MQGFDWNDLKYFLAIARTGKLTTAARQLGVDHATASRRVSALEQDLKAKLFERGPQGYRLTTCGEQMLSFAEEIESQSARASCEIGESDLVLSGHVRIGAPDGFGACFLAPLIWDLCRQHPGLNIDLVAMPRVFSMSKREADMAISLSRPTAGRLNIRKLTDYRLGLFASREYLARRGPINDVSELGRHRMIGYIEDLIFTPELDYLPQIDKNLQTKFASTNLLAQLNATKAGAGICVLPYFLLACEPDLIPVLPDEVNIERTFWLVTHADLAGALRIKVTGDFIARQVEKSRKLFLEL